MSKINLGTITDTKSHEQSDGTTLIELINEEQIVMATILVADPKIGRISIRKDGHLVVLGSFPIIEFLNNIDIARTGERNLPALKISPLN